MNQILLNKTEQSYQEAKSYVIFLLVAAPLYAITFRYTARNHVILSILLFFLGWFTWTFIEYILHRFWNHEKGDAGNKIVQKHIHHHTHPTDIYVSATHRGLLLVGDLLLIGFSIWINPYVFLVAGIWTGVFCFFLMHYFLHQKWFVKFFPRLVHYHIIHHCKEPDTCFGVTNNWWDRVFGTLPKKNKEIPERVISFYYSGEKKSKSPRPLGSMVDEKLT